MTKQILLEKNCLDCTFRLAEEEDFFSNNILFFATIKDNVFDEGWNTVITVEKDSRDKEYVSFKINEAGKFTFPLDNVLTEKFEPDMVGIFLVKK